MSAIELMECNDSLLKAILANPASDDARLVYADVLMQQGHPRGEFIHLQIKTTLASLGQDHPEDIRWLCQREAELLKHHEAEWLREAGAFGQRVVFCRGFIDSLSFSPEKQPMAQLDSIFTREPIQKLKIERLSGPAEVIDFVHCEALRTLYELDLSFTEDFSLALLQLKSTPLEKLQSFALSNVDGRYETIHDLVACSFISQLRKLDLSSTQLGLDSIKLLANSGLIHLERLDLCSNDIASEGVLALAQGSSMPDVRSLAIARNHVDCCGVKALVNGGKFRHLEHLNVHSNHIRTQGFHSIFQSDLSHLKSLDIGGNSGGPTCVDALLRAKSFPLLTQLNLVGLAIGKGLSKLTDCPVMSSLKMLSLACNAIDDDSLKSFLKSPARQSLEALNLAQNDLTDESMRALAECPYVSNLRSLTVDSNRISDKGVQALLDSPYLEKLESFSHFVHFPTETRERLRKRWPRPALVST